MGKRTQKKRKDSGALWTVIVIAVMAVGGLAMMQWIARPQTESMVDARKAEGSEQAQVTLIEFGDYL